MGVSLKTVRDGLPNFDVAVKKLTKTRVLVGVPSTTAARTEGDAHGADQSINNATLAYIHDNGAPEAGIPARPFMMPGIRNAKADIEAGLKKAGDAALETNDVKMNQAFNRVGIQAVSSIQEKITEGPFVPLKPETIRRKGSDKPLIDTGQLRRSITYVIRGTGP